MAEQGKPLNAQVFSEIYENYLKNITVIHLYLMKK